MNISEFKQIPTPSKIDFAIYHVYRSGVVYFSGCGDDLISAVSVKLGVTCNSVSKAKDYLIKNKYFVEREDNQEAYNSARAEIREENIKRQNAFRQQLSDEVGGISPEDFAAIENFIYEEWDCCLVSEDFVSYFEKLVDLARATKLSRV